MTMQTNTLTPEIPRADNPTSHESNYEPHIKTGLGGNALELTAATQGLDSELAPVRSVEVIIEELDNYDEELENDDVTHEYNKEFPAPKFTAEEALALVERHTGYATERLLSHLDCFDIEHNKLVEALCSRLDAAQLRDAFRSSYPFRPDTSLHDLTLESVHTLRDAGVDASPAINDAEAGALALELIGKYAYTDTLAKLVEKATGAIDPQVAYAILEHNPATRNWNHVELVLRKFEDFPGIDAVRVLDTLSHRGASHLCIPYFSKLTGIDSRTFINQVMAEQPYVIGDTTKRLSEHIDQFAGLTHNQLAHIILDSDNPGSAQGIASALNVLSGLDIEVARVLYANNLAYEVICHQSSFGDFDLRAVLIDEGRNPRELVDAYHSVSREWPDIGLDKAIPISTDYADASYTYLSGGFSRKAIGGIIQTRMEHNMELSVHDASQWLEKFQMPDACVDIDKLKASVAAGEQIEADELEMTLRDAGTEAQFIRQLLDADSTLRDKLTYGTAPALRDRDKFMALCRKNPDLHRELQTNLGRERAALTRIYYDELLADPEISEARQEFQAKKGADATERQFFKKYFASHATLKDELERRVIAVQVRLESDLLARVLDANPDYIDSIANKTSTDGEDLFYYPEYRLLYQAACSEKDGKQLYKKPDFSIDDLFGQAHAMLDSYYDECFSEANDTTFHDITPEDLRQDLNKAFEVLTGSVNQNNEEDWKVQLQNAYLQLINRNNPHAALSHTTTKLKQMRHNRKRYIQDTQNWLRRHATTKSGSITQAWGDRVHALLEGTDDGVSAIRAWQHVNALQVEVNRLEASGELQEKGLDREYIKSKADDVMELSRVLSGKDTLRALAKMKRWREKREWQEKILPTSTANAEVEGTTYKLEIFDKDDPRGFTIGEDTACCMTIDGVSANCIKAGYTQQNTGFLGVYLPGDNLLAQSFYYVHPDEPNVLVIDNIEANKGRDTNKLLKIYQKTLKEYLSTFAPNIEEVRVGTGYSAVYLNNLRQVRSPRVLGGIYTDAERQMILIGTKDLKGSRQS